MQDAQPVQTKASRIDTTRTGLTVGFAQNDLDSLAKCQLTLRLTC
jgi:hypothetical protein